MKVVILGIDGLDLSIIENYQNELPNFELIRSKGKLRKVETVFPADSVPAWNTIFTGLNPAEHGMIRGLDFVEKMEGKDKLEELNLEGKTFWDYLSRQNKKCLIINPFLAYPAWKINGLMESGPAFVVGKPSIYPEEIETKYPEALGGYSPVSNLKNLHKEVAKAINDTKKLWEEFKYQSNNVNYDLSFITFTTLDRIQHYTWRFFDKNDPLYEYDEYLSFSILVILRLFDNFIGELLQELKTNDKLIIISDHGFSQRPYKLINLNEILRQEGLLKLNSSDQKISSWDKNFHKVKKHLISFLSKSKKLELIPSIIKFLPFLRKYKKSDYLIDKIHSFCYVDEYFNGKKPYCGINFGVTVKKGDKHQKKEIIDRFKRIFTDSELPELLWIKENYQVYEGPFYDRYPDICFELPKEFGIEFELFGDILTTSATHYKISGGHLGDGTFGYYSPIGKTKEIESILEFYGLITNLFNES